MDNQGSFRDLVFNQQLARLVSQSDVDVLVELANDCDCDEVKHNIDRVSLSQDNRDVAQLHRDRDQELQQADYKGFYRCRKLVGVVQREFHARERTNDLVNDAQVQDCSAYPPRVIY